MNAPPLPAARVKVTAVVSSALAGLPIAVPALSTRPDATTSTSVSPSGSPSTIAPERLPMLTLAVPAVTVSSVMSPVPACRLMLPSTVVVVTDFDIGMDCDIVIAWPASRSIVLPLPRLVMSAFCRMSRVAFRLMWPLLDTTSALSVMSALLPPAFKNRFPLVTLMPSVPGSTSPSLTKIEPATVCSTRLPVTIRSDCSTSVLAVTATAKPSAVTRLTAIAAVWLTSIALASSRYRPLPRTLALSLAISVSTWFALVPTATAALRRNTLA